MCDRTTNNMEQSALEHLWVMPLLLTFFLGFQDTTHLGLAQLLRPLFHSLLHKLFSMLCVIFLKCYSSTFCLMLLRVTLGDLIYS